MLSQDEKNLMLGLFENRIQDGMAQLRKLIGIAPSSPKKRKNPNAKLNVRPASINKADAASSPSKQGRVVNNKLSQPTSAGN